MLENVLTIPVLLVFSEGIAGEFNKALYEMPFAFSSPEWSNEKGIDAALGFRLNGISSYHCVEAPIHGSSKVIEFLKKERKNTSFCNDCRCRPCCTWRKIVADMKENENN